MRILRTPDERFENLPGYPYEPHYADVSVSGDMDPGKAFKKWRQFSQETPVFPIGEMLQRSTTTELSAEVMAAYDAPFPAEEYKAGARQFPILVPITPDDPEAQPNRDAWKVLQAFKKPWLCAFSDQDPVTRGADQFIKAVIPGCKGQPHTTIKDGGHFLQEDKGEELANVTLDFIRATTL